MELSYRLADISLSPLLYSSLRIVRTDVHGTHLFFIFVDREEPEIQRDVAQPHSLLLLLHPAQH